MYRLLTYSAAFLLLLLLAGYLLPNKTASPILPADIAKIDPESFWCYPWGNAGVHKGIDIFCKKGTPVFAPVSGMITRVGYGTISGNYISMIGPRWRTYYFAHLDTVYVKGYRYVTKGQLIGKAGNTGNAASKPCHLHYAIETIFPYTWLYDKDAIEGWKKMFYLNPNRHLHLQQ